MASPWQSIALLGVLFAAYQACSALISLRENIKIAKRTGFPYVVARTSDLVIVFLSLSLSMLTRFMVSILIVLGLESADG
jgi:hypothetical protein